ncbi:hypothetical protein [Synechococcus phage metaG-MbCM1]|jgi:hypothetical protein|uniref:Uncharacterized protein n=1 Tax=Synechococcus phage metaG-MbCM1 TaxID=1079999 RepID=H8ZN53_9CAUD|nr:hypothetical protein [Synechococcus phage metaG-MbCM1]AFD02914.1 hypothetical protein [Synechococcus phage metaG-MbCM1]
MNSTSVYVEPVNRIKQRILFDDNLQNMACCCCDWAEFVVEINEWGIERLGGVWFDDLTEFDIQHLDIFIKAENGYIREEV